jgi:hypothetical protein
MMSTKHVRTAADLVRFGASVRIDCANCGAARTMTGVEMAKACGTGSLADSRARMRCDQCGARSAKLTVLSPP